MGLARAAGARLLPTGSGAAVRDLSGRTRADLAALMPEAHELITRARIAALGYGRDLGLRAAIRRSPHWAAAGDDLRAAVDLYLTTEIEGDTGEYTPAAKDRPEAGVYSSPAEAIMAAQRLVRRLPVGESIVEAILDLVRSARVQATGDTRRQWPLLGAVDGLGLIIGDGVTPRRLEHRHLLAIGVGAPDPVLNTSRPRTRLPARQGDLLALTIVGGKED